jgi:hypothetical protein
MNEYWIDCKIFIRHNKGEEKAKETLRAALEHDGYEVKI